MPGESFYRPQGGAGTLDGTLARMFRRTCTDCGSRDLAWMHLVDLVRVVHDVDRDHVHELLHELGPAADAWRCLACATWGAFTGFGVEESM